MVTKQSILKKIEELHADAVAFSASDGINGPKVKTLIQQAAAALDVKTGLKLRGKGGGGRLSSSSRFNTTPPNLSRVTTSKPIVGDVVTVKAPDADEPEIEIKVEPSGEDLKAGFITEFNGTSLGKLTSKYTAAQLNQIADLFEISLEGLTSKKQVVAALKQEFKA